jgi:hypothetical protein
MAFPLPSSPYALPMLTKTSTEGDEEGNEGNEEGDEEGNEEDNEEGRRTVFLISGMVMI